MTLNKLALAISPIALMAGSCLGLMDADRWLASIGGTPAARQLLGRIGIVAPYAVGAALGLIFLFAANGSKNVRFAGMGVGIGALTVVGISLIRETTRLSSFAGAVPRGESVMQFIDPTTSFGALLTTMVGAFALRVALRGNAAFSIAAPRRMRGKRAIHGESEWMSLREATQLFPEAGGMVIGEAYRVDKDTIAGHGFRADDKESWGAGGRSPLLCFDSSFGSTHGLVFAGSGGFKTTSVTVPTALKWGGGLVALDPSNEVAPMVIEHRRRAGHSVFVLDPKDPGTGFNVLDWIGRFGGTKEEDVVAVANWVVTDCKHPGRYRRLVYAVAATRRRPWCDCRQYLVL